VTTLVWSANFVRAFKRLARKDPQLTSKAKRALELLSSEASEKVGATHKRAEAGTAI
jgi:mRNA-degrading endonuclease YafQ of YafQ-DinJ toxin-antitoxin module